MPGGHNFTKNTKVFLEGKLLWCKNRDGRRLLFSVKATVLFMQAFSFFKCLQAYLVREAILRNLQEFFFLYLSHDSVTMWANQMNVRKPSISKNNSVYRCSFRSLDYIYREILVYPLYIYKYIYSMLEG